ncbi:unnamed protein product [Thelazia callipaeda]|uniref:Arginase n=1 Tax=Thelazia callipaeda TaxID=103827 RepID=A0A0N5D5K7_THECL|nr:unnamed protein product [Thelazia callipaeda]
MMKNLKVIGCANGSGGPFMGADKGVEIMQKSDFMKYLKINYEWVDVIEEKATGLQVDALPGVIDTSLRLAKRTFEEIKKGHDLLVIGGDHSSAIGTWSGVSYAIKNDGKIGLIWVDAHLDAHQPSTSPSGNIHGMPVAHLLGFGQKALYNLFDYFPKLDPKYIVFIGVRSFEEAERVFLDSLMVKIYEQSECDERGIDVILKEAIKLVSDGTVGFGLSIDMDAFRESDCPGVSTPAEGGIVAQEFIAAIKKADLTKLIATEMVEFMPKKDKERKTEKVLVELVDAIYGNKFGMENEN